MTFGEALFKEMYERKMTATVLARRSGVSDQYISKLLNGKVKEPTWPKACALIDALDMATDEFRAVMEEQ